MKRPFKPAEPHKPMAPLKTIQVANRVYLNNHRITFDEALAQIPAGTDLKNISVVEYDHPNYDCSCCGSYSEVYIEYYTEQENKFYDKQKTAYDKKIKEYYAKLEKYKPKFEAFIKEKEAYDTWFANSLEENRKLREKQELESLRKKVKQLEKKLHKGEKK